MEYPYHEWDKLSWIDRQHHLGDVGYDLVLSVNRNETTTSCNPPED